MQKHYIFSDFEACCGEVFHVDTQSGQLALNLESVELSEERHRRTHAIHIGDQPVPEREPFRLVFKGPISPELAPNSYYVQHEKLGRNVIFLSALGPLNGHQLYEAIFN